jgi:molecular chaperone GrpE
MDTVMSEVDVAREAGHGQDVGSNERTEIDRLKEELDEQRARNVRPLADLDNLRRRAAGEKLSAQTAIQRSVLIGILPALDALERALVVGSSDEQFYDGVAATLRLFTRALSDIGAEPFDSVGHPFDPTLHEAIDVIRADDAQPGTITRQILRGWRLGGDIVRPARVIVADNRREAPGDV